MEFKKYQHVCRIGTQETEGILDGVCYIQPKIDGTNGSLFLNEEGEVCAGSRKRQLSTFEDNQGFYNHIVKDERIISYLKKHPTHRLYGEWLKPHSLRTYNDNAWDKFYVFDVCIDDGEELSYLEFDDYKPLLEEFKIDYIPTLAVASNPTIDLLTALLNKNTYLINENKGCGEGIVIKNYDYKNKYGRVVWAKIIHNEFNNRGSQPKGKLSDSEEISIEIKIVNRYVTNSLVEKEYQKIINEEDIIDKQVIPKLLNTTYHCLITEEMWNVVKEYKNPSINFKKLQNLVINKIREVKPDLFVRKD